MSSVFQQVPFVDEPPSACESPGNDRAPSLRDPPECLGRRAFLRRPQRPLAQPHLGRLGRNTRPGSHQLYCARSHPLHLPLQAVRQRRELASPHMSVMAERERLKEREAWSMVAALDTSVSFEFVCLELFALWVN